MTGETVDTLFARLMACENADSAAEIERSIWRIWVHSDDAGVAEWMERGMHASNIGDLRSALVAFNHVVEDAPEFAEGWNKRATLYWLMGRHEASLADIDRTLALEPRHFGALSGAAMIHETHGRIFEALEALERVVRIYPQLPHLTDRIDQLTRRLGETL